MRDGWPINQLPSVRAMRLCTTSSRLNLNGKRLKTGIRGQAFRRLEGYDAQTHSATQSCESVLADDVPVKHFFPTTSDARNFIWENPQHGDIISRSGGRDLKDGTPVLVLQDTL